MGRIVTGGIAATFNLALHLDPQTLDLYGVADYFNTPGYVGGAAAIWVDGSHNVGIGTTPSCRFHMRDTTADLQVRLENAATGAHTYTFLLSGNGGTNPAGSFALFDSTAGASRILVDSAGNVGINLSSTWTGGFEKFASYTNTANARAGSFWNNHNSAGSALLARVDFTAARLAEFFYTGVTSVGTITTNGTSTTYGTTSDHRLKDDVSALEGSGAFIDALQPRSWTWKSSGERGAGFIAHELQAVSPSSVHGEKDAVDEDGKPILQSVGYGSPELVAMLVAEVKSLRARLAALEAKA